MYYIEAALADYKEDGNTESIWMALRDVVEAQAAVSELSIRTGIDAETLSGVLSKEGAPRLDVLSTILKSFGCQLAVEPRTDVNVNIETADMHEVYPRTSTN